MLQLSPARATGTQPRVATGGLAAIAGLLVVLLLAAACVAASGVTIAVGHLHSTTTYDVLLWGVGLLLLVRLLRTGDRRLWLAIGLVAGSAC